MVVQDIHDPHRPPVSERPRSGVDLPRIVGPWPLETTDGRVWPFTRLRRNKPAAHKNPVNRSHRGNRCRITAAGEVIRDGLRTAVDPKVLAQPNDRVFGLRRYSLR